MEIRSIRATLNNEGHTLTGYVALYNSPSRMLSERGRRFVEVIAPKAFERSLKENPDIVANWMHDDKARPPLGRTSAGTLRLASDDTGLRFSLDMPQWASDLTESVKRGDVTGMSFGFNRERDSWTVQNGTSVRTLHDFHLDHVSLVVKGAYPAAYAEIRCHVEPPASHPVSVKEAELALRKRKI